jgi:hypothetical protein
MNGKKILHFMIANVIDEDKFVRTKKTTHPFSNGSLNKSLLKSLSKLKKIIN